MEYHKPPVYQNNWNATALVSTFDMENLRRQTDYNRSLVKKQKKQKIPEDCRGCAGREIVLCALVIFFCGVAAVTLTLYFIKDTSDTGSQEPHSKTCNTEACVSIASHLLQSIDESVDPCEDFFEFSCGNWIRTHDIPDDKPLTGITDGLRENLQRQIRGLLERENFPSDEPEAVLDAVTTYKSCLDTSTIEDLGIAPILEVVRDYGGWPMIDPSWSPQNYDIMDIVGRMSHLGVGIFMGSMVVPSFEDSTKHVMMINQAGLGMPSRDYFLGNRFDPRLLAYERLALDVAVLLGANPASALVETTLVINFEIELAKILIPAELRRALADSYKNMTIAELSDDITDRIDWLAYFNNIFKPVGKTVDTDFSVMVFDSEYLHRLGLLWEAFDKRTVANYMMWRLVKANMLSYPDVFYEKYLKYQQVLAGKGESRDRWKLCVNDINSNMPMAVGRLYVENIFDKQSKIEVEEMILYLRQTFLAMLDKAEWLDDSTRANAWKKAIAMKQKIGFPDYILDDKELEKLFGGLTVQEDRFLANTINRAQVGRRRNLKKLSEPVDDTRWILGPAVFNAYYAWLQNEIVFPAGLFQRPIFDKNFPKYINFGGVGFIIGHEITHGFDDQGRNFDEYGNLNDWWTPEVKDNFHLRAACMDRQYSNFNVSGVEDNVNGKLTLGENIADNGGIKESFKAYRTWVSDSGQEESILPGLDYTPNQLFFISYAQQFCSKETKQLLEIIVKTDQHSPGKFRTIGALQNLEEFASTFQCKKESHMNPETKCSVW